MYKVFKITHVEEKLSGCVLLIFHFKQTLLIFSLKMLCKLLIYLCNCSLFFSLILFKYSHYLNEINSCLVFDTCVHVSIIIPKTLENQNKKATNT